MGKMLRLREAERVVRIDHDIKIRMWRVLSKMH